MSGTFSYDGGTLSSADSTTGWSHNLSSLSAGDDFTSNRKQGTNILEFDYSGTGWRYMRYSIGSSINLMQNDISFWFYYTAKAEQVLGSSNSIVLRAYTGSGTTNYGEWNLSGHTNPALFRTLIASWNKFIVSGDNPSTVAGSPNFSNVTAVEIRYYFNSANTQNGDPDLGFDWLKYGSTITVTDGTDISPADFSSMDMWSQTSGTEYGIAVLTDVFMDMWAGVNIGNGSTFTYFAAENTFMFNNQFSKSCQHDWNVTNNATLRLGKLDSKSQEDYPINGCSMIVRENPIDGEVATPIADFTVDNGGTLLSYSTKYYRWNNVVINGNADIRDCDFDNCANITLNNPSIEIRNTKFHDPSGSGYLGYILVAPSILENVSVFNCQRGFHFKTNMTVSGYKATDNVVDLVVDDNLTITLVNSEFDPNKILQE